MKSPQERLARVLEKHPKFYEVAPDGDYTGAIIRRGQFLVPARHASAVEEKARGWTNRRTDLPPLGAAWFTLSGDTDVTEVIANEFSPEGQDPLASPVHMFRGEPNYQGGPGDTPAPVAEPLPDPPKGSSSHAVTVAVMDTGLSTNHSWFPKNSWEAVDDDITDRLDVDGDYQLDAQAGHGTFIAGIVRQQAAGARLMISRVLGSDGVCDEIELLQALRALQHLNRLHNRRIGVINLSLGAYTWNNQPPPLVSQVIKRAQRRRRGGRRSRQQFPRPEVLAGRLRLRRRGGCAHGGRAESHDVLQLRRLGRRLGAGPARCEQLRRVRRPRGRGAEGGHRP